MTDFDALKVHDFDHVEFAVNDLDKSAQYYFQMGFEKIATREIRERKLKSYLLSQNDAYVLLSQSTDPKDPVGRYVAQHGEGVLSVALRCEDAVSALEVAVKRGAEVAESPRSFQKDFGSVQSTAIKAFGDVRHTFISRQGNLFAEGFDVPYKSNIRGYGLKRIDHLTCNVAKGQMEGWAAFYERILGLTNTRFFDIHTERTGLYSKVMESPDHKIKIPVNEPTESASQIQEFIDIHHGPGVQHIAFETGNILETLPSLRKEGVRFLAGVPQTYYEELPKRVPGITENLSVVSEMGVLIDGSKKGYLLQIFTENAVGPLFFEIIQRKGDDGFGEGNFKALFEAIERDQIRRGVLKA